MFLREGVISKICQSNKVFKGQIVSLLHFQLRQYVPERRRHFDNLSEKQSIFRDKLLLFLLLEMGQFVPERRRHFDNLSESKSMNQDKLMLSASFKWDNLSSSASFCLSMIKPISLFMYQVGWQKGSQ